MHDRINIYQMYIRNNCRFGFYVKRDSWQAGRYAKVVGIEWVEEGKMIKGSRHTLGVLKTLRATPGPEKSRDLEL